MSEPERQPIHYRFVSIDEQCSSPPPAPSSSSTKNAATPSSACSSVRSSREPSSSSDRRESKSSESVYYSDSEDDDDGGDPSCFALVRQFYDELMVPTFPIEEERDDLDDWLDCFRDQAARSRRLRNGNRSRNGTHIGRGSKEEEVVVRVGDDDDGDDGDCEFDGPAMDVVLMVREDEPISSDSKEEDDAEDEEDHADNDRHFQRRDDALLRGKRGSLYGGLYAPTHNKDDDEVGEVENDDDDDDRVRKRGVFPSQKPTIIGGAAVEYYRRARVGLLSYVVLGDEFRGHGLAGGLHGEALRRLEALANCYNYGATNHSDDAESSPTRNEEGEEEEPPLLLRAVFAETNTPAAGDVTPLQSLARHKSLYNLGYRLVRFPYAQPPLTTEDVNGSFDDVVLLVYFPFDPTTAGCREEASLESREQRDGGGPTSTAAETTMRYCRWFEEERRGDDGGSDYDDDDDADSRAVVVHMDVDIPFQYVEDFYQSVFGYDTDEGDNRGRDEGTVPDYRTADYYRLARWFARARDSTGDSSSGRRVAEVRLRRPTATDPWGDCKDELILEMEQWGEEERAPSPT